MTTDAPPLLRPTLHAQRLSYSPVTYSSHPSAATRRNSCSFSSAFTTSQTTHPSHTLPSPLTHCLHLTLPLSRPPYYPPSLSVAAGRSLHSPPPNRTGCQITSLTPPLYLPPAVRQSLSLSKISTGCQMIPSLSDLFPHLLLDYPLISHFHPH